MPGACRRAATTNTSIIIVVIVLGHAYGSEFCQLSGSGHSTLDQTPLHSTPIESNPIQAEITSLGRHTHSTPSFLLAKIDHKKHSFGFI